jgi:hypothetical protein
MFWAIVTAGRLLFALVQRWSPSRLAYHLLPLTISFGQERLASMSAAMAGLVIAF